MKEMSCAAKERCYGVQDASPPAVARLFEVVGGLGYAQPTDHFKRLAMRRLLYLVTMALSLSTHLPLQTTCDAPQALRMLEKDCLGTSAGVISPILAQNVHHLLLPLVCLYGDKYVACLNLFLIIASFLLWYPHIGESAKNATSRSSKQSTT